MRFQRLRLSGFKSFVEPVEFRIEAGLTGVVGPNGCGKSNLLEALRWVMGANSAKAMRAEGMDDVIFGGTGKRPARNHAEVSLQIDNAERKAPPRFNDQAVLEVTRRIVRGSGSVYKINGVEARAKDVQLLFADASTGANSPSLVRQGQISELVGAKPSNRRRILEEAAGVSGLHARRHEASLRLNAAEANLARLEDVAQEIESGLNRLKREARQAEKYKRLSADIRTLQGAALLARWVEARAGLVEAEGAVAAAAEAVEQSARAAAQAGAAALAAAETIKPKREEAMIAAAVLQRLAVERDRLEREAEQAEAESARLAADLARNSADQEREGQMAADAKGALSRLTHDLSDLARAIAQAPERLPALDAAVKDAAAAREQAETAVELLAGEAASLAARRRSAEAALEQARMAHRQAGERANQAEARLQRLDQAMALAKNERAALPGAGPALEDAQKLLAKGVASLHVARAEVERAEAARSEATKAESLARDLARKLDDNLSRLKTEGDGLRQLLAPPNPGKSGSRTALEQVTPEPGYEAAVAAAFGDDLEAALAHDAAIHGALAYWGPDFWSDGSAVLPDWPVGATPLSAFVAAPEPLAGRLAMTALVNAAEGPRLQKALPTGARLVSKAGDLWRWDGYTQMAGAPRPAARRFAQKARLIEIEAAIADLSPQVQAAQATHKAATDRLRQCEDAVRQSRKGPEMAERAVAQARDAADIAGREAARLETRAQALDDAIVRLAAESHEARQLAQAAASDVVAAANAMTQALADAAPLADDPAQAAANALALGRQTLAAAREAETRARAALDSETRAVDGRLRRREGLLKEETDWAKRAAAAEARLTRLETERAAIVEALAAAKARPQDLRQRQIDIHSAFAAAERRQAEASAALIDAESAAGGADRALRSAEKTAADLREQRAAAAARLDGARDRLAVTAQQVRDAAQVEPEALGARLSEAAVAIPTDPAGVETHLRALERDREALGAVNLRAEEELQERAGRHQALLKERADLSAAIAKLREAVASLNAEGRERLLAAFTVINESFKSLFQTLFEGGEADLRLAESEDPLEAGLEIYACPPGKRLATLSLMSGGEQALTATALILAVFLSNPAPVCVLDEVDAPLDDANVDRFCRLLDEMRRRTDTRFIAITHNPVTMSRMDRLYGVTMAERGVSQLVSVDLRQAEAMIAQAAPAPAH